MDTLECIAESLGYIADTLNDIAVAIEQLTNQKGEMIQNEQKNA